MGVPLRMIPPTTTTKELIIRIKECIEKGDDDLLDTYGVTVEKSDLI